VQGLEGLRFYSPPQAYNLNTTKVAIVTDNTSDAFGPDRFLWVPEGQEHTGINGFDAFRKVLRRYEDGSIDVLILSGHRGGMCTVNTTSQEDLGGWRMPDDIYALVRRKMSRKGQIILEGCACGGKRDFVQRTANKFRLPITATTGITRGDWGDGGGSSDEPWFTVRPTPRKRR
jgi:hypothetical protein